MKWKKEFVEHLNSSISISMGLHTWQGSPFEEEPTTIHVQLPNVEHYGGNTNPFPPIRIIQHYNLCFELGNVIKYVLRDKGSKVEDLKKAIDYLNFEISKHENK